MQRQNQSLTCALYGSVYIHVMNRKAFMVFEQLTDDISLSVIKLATGKYWPLLLLSNCINYVMTKLNNKL